MKRDVILSAIGISNMISLFMAVFLSVHKNAIARDFLQMVKIFREGL